MRSPLATCRSKADEVRDERDRQKVLIQITQNLAPRIHHTHAFELPTIFLPRQDPEVGGIPNAIEDVCNTMKKVCLPYTCKEWGFNRWPSSSLRGVLM